MAVSKATFAMRRLARPVTLRNASAMSSLGISSPTPLNMLRSA